VVGRLMRFLVDTNIWLELLLNQERSEEVRQLFERWEGFEFARGMGSGGVQKLSNESR
jgi:hypothetical protein